MNIRPTIKTCRVAQLPKKHTLTLVLARYDEVNFRLYMLKLKGHSINILNTFFALTPLILKVKRRTVRLKHRREKDVSKETKEISCKSEDSLELGCTMPIPSL